MNYNYNMINSEIKSNSLNRIVGNLLGLGLVPVCFCLLNMVRTKLSILENSSLGSSVLPSLTIASFQLQQDFIKRRQHA